MPQQPAVYILANRPRGTLYIGVTGNLLQRIHQHRNGDIVGFTSRYCVTQLVYYELAEEMSAAIVREKRLKKWRRLWKLRLIENFNPQWRDLGVEVMGA